MTIGILGLAPVFIAAQRSASSGMHRARALALATRDIEEYRSVPYCSLGFATGTDPSVVVANPAPGLPSVSGSEVVDGITYTFARTINWVSTTNLATTPTTTNSKAYKQVSVVVKWREATQDYTVRQESVVYPGGIGAYSGSGGSCGVTGTAGLSAPPKPVTDLSAATDGTNPESSVVLNWSDPASPNFDKYKIVYSTDNFATSYVFLDANLTVVRPFRVPGLSAGTTYQFQVLSARSTSGEYTPSNRVSISTQAAVPPPGCTVTSAQVSAGTPASPGAKQLAGGSTLESNATFRADTSGSSCASLRIFYVPDEGSATVVTALLTESPTNVWTGSVNGLATNWSVGPHTISVADSSGTVMSSSTRFTVCLSSVSSCP
jgi:hypothetical protein